MPDPLKKYRQMRDFGEPQEPAGGNPKKPKLPIFVIQKHSTARWHYDFRLEMEGVLKSWAVPKGPSYDPTQKRLAMMTEDHPYDYGSFEGVIPEGNYGAGNVIIWDTGEWEFIEPGDDPVKAVQQGKLAFRLYGKKMFGEWALVKIKGRSPKGNEWLVLKHRDKYANANVDVTEVAPRSVVSNLDVDEIGAERTWIINRPASARRTPTLASRLAAEKEAATKASAKLRAPAARPRAASSRKRSSRDESPRSARPTRRRRLR